MFYIFERFLPLAFCKLDFWFGNQLFLLQLILSRFARICLIKSTNLFLSGDYWSDAFHTNLKENVYFLFS